MRWYWHALALVLIVGGTGASVATGVPLFAWVGVVSWFVGWRLTLGRRRTREG